LFILNINNLEILKIFVKNLRLIPMHNFKQLKEIVYRMRSFFLQLAQRII